MSRLRSPPSRIGRQPPKLKAPPKQAEAFYQSREWRRTVADIKRQRGNWCQRCGSKDRVIADHIIERKDGGANLDEANIELLCFTHHQRKTAAARAKRASGPIR